MRSITCTMGALGFIWAALCPITTLAQTNTLWIRGVNLSEDMSTLSSRNDEMLLIIYTYEDSTSVSPPVVMEYFVLDSLTKERSITVPCLTNQVLILLLELDTQRSPEQIEARVRPNLQQLQNFHKANDRNGIQKLIGDEDIMGIRLLPTLCAKRSFSFSGRYKLDKFSYTLVLGERKQPDN
jgi:hypothetical protein